MAKRETETASPIQRLFSLISPPSRDKMQKLIPIRRVEDNLFQMADDSFMDVISITTKDLFSASEDDFEYYVATWSLFYRKCGSDLKLVALNTPTDTREQQGYLRRKIEKNKNPIYDVFLKENLNKLIEIEKVRTDRQFFLFLFAKSMDEYLESYALIRQILYSNSLAEELQLPEKYAVLSKINNKTATMQVRNAKLPKNLYPEKAKVEETIKKKGYDPWLMHTIQPAGGLSPVSERYLSTGLGYEACIQITKFPARLDSCWLSRLMNIDNVITMIDVKTEDANASKRNINAGFREQLIRLNDATETSDIKVAQQRYAELEALWDDIDVLGEVLKILRVRLFVSGETYADCDVQVREVIGHLVSVGYEASVYLNESVQDFKSAYQSYTRQYEDENSKIYARYGQPVESITLADGIPFHYTNLMDSCGMYLGTTNSNNGSVLFDIHNVTSSRNSYNGAIFGQMGSGKSTFIKKLMLQIAARGHFIRGFDPSGEYKPLNDKLGGAYISLDGTAGILNIFEILRTSDEGENMCFVNHLAKLHTVYSLLKPEASIDEMSSFELYAQEFYIFTGLIDPELPVDEQQITGLSASKYPILSEFVQFLAERKRKIRTVGDSIADDLSIAEARRCDAIHRTMNNLLISYGKLFDGHTSIDNILDRQVVFFNIKNLAGTKSEIFDVQIFLALQLCWDNCVKVGIQMKRLYEDKKVAFEDITRFEIFIDESHQIINTQKPVALDQIAAFQRQARKYFGGVVYASQSLRDHVPDGSASEAVNKIKTMFEMCDYKFIFRQDSNVIPLLQQVFSGQLTSSDVQAIPTLAKGTMIMCLSSERSLQMQVEITEEEKDLFSGGV